MSKELLQQALELAMRCPWSEERAKLADTLRSALAAPAMEAEPCYCDRMQIGVPGVSCGDCPRDYKPAAPAPAVPDLKHKPTVQRLMDLARKFRSAPGDLYDGAYKELQSACYEALSAAPVVREPQYWCPETGELCGKCAKTGTCEASILQAHGIGGGGK